MLLKIFDLFLLSLNNEIHQRTELLKTKLLNETISESKFNHYVDLYHQQKDEAIRKFIKIIIENTK